MESRLLEAATARPPRFTALSAYATYSTAGYKRPMRLEEVRRYKYRVW